MARRAPSLFFRLAWRIAAVTVLVLSSFVLFLAWRLDVLVADLEDRTLTRQARDIARHVVAEEGVFRLELPAALVQSYLDAAANSRAAFAVIGPDGRFVAGSPGVTAPLAHDLAVAPPEGEAFFVIPRGSDTPALAGVAMAFGEGDAAFVVQAAQSEDHGDVLLDTVMEEFAAEHGWVAVAFLALLLAITFATVRTTLRPVRKASDLAARIAPGDAAARLPEDDMPSEIRPLIEAVNLAFDRLQKGIAVQRSFSADAAHQLRTPLAILTARLDQVADPARRHQLKADAAVINRIVAQLLHAAQAETFSLSPGATVDLVETAREVATYLAPVAVASGITIDLLGGEEGPVVAHGEREALEHAIRNLVENAIGHAPAGSAVEIVIEAPATLRVIDRGPGVPPDQRPHLVRRFWRADRSTSGAGLGLAIVAQVAEAHGARLDIDDAPADAEGRRGAMFSLVLRPASSAR